MLINSISKVTGNIYSGESITGVIVDPSGTGLTTIDAAFDAMPNGGNILLAAGTHNIASDSLTMPDNTKLYAIDPNPANTNVVGKGGQNFGDTTAAIRLGDGCVCDGFTILGAPDSNPGFDAPFSILAGTTVDAVLRRIIHTLPSTATPYDFVYVNGKGTLLVDRCQVETFYDGIAVYDSCDVTVRHSYFYSQSANANNRMNLLRVDDAGADLTVIGSKLHGASKTTSPLSANCIGGGLAGTTAVANTVTVRGCDIQITKTAGATCNGIAKNTGTINIYDTSIVAVNDTVSTDYCLNFEDATGVISNSTVSADNATTAQTQNDAGTNTVTGFKIT